MRIATLSLALLLATPALADPRADATAIVEATVTEDIFAAAMNAQAPYIASAIENDLRAQGITISDPATFTQIIMEEMLTTFTVGMQEPMIELYLDLFTAEELADLRAFYETPAGQAWIDAQPAIIEASTRTGEQVGAAVVPEMMPRVSERLEAEGVEISDGQGVVGRLIDMLR